MELSQEDAFCLNVLLAAGVQAVRIDASTMTVHALTEKGEAKVKLHPNTREEAYLKLVKQTLAEHALESPEGYPVYLRRWTRMGQMRDENLAPLLKLGEPEAVVAVVHAPGLTDELARRAWWAMPTIENARRMLEKEAVARGSMGPILAEFLVEHLPFEDDVVAIMDTVRTLLWFDLVDEAAQKKLWARGKQHGAYYIGFLEQRPDRLPVTRPARCDYETQTAKLQPLIAAGNPYAEQLDRLLASRGQSFLAALEEAMERPGTHEIVSALLNSIGAYFGGIAHLQDRPCTVEEVEQRAQRLLSSGEVPAIAELVAAVPGLHGEMLAMLTLAGINEWVAYNVLRRTTAVNALLRSKLSPVFDPILAQVRLLRQLPQRA
ncbi:MAG: hypothetical protein K6T56_05955 [Burkholderiales bacterium]|nr:hypothetical protein [Burkholderiales bacterium]